MPGSNMALIVMPLLVSGFLFALIFYPTRFLSAKFDGQRLFFFAATLGIFFGVVTSLLFPALDNLTGRLWPSHWTPVGLLLKPLIPIETPGTFVACILVALLCALMLNLIFCIKITFSRKPFQLRSGWQWTIKKLVPRIGDPLQQLLIRAVTLQKKVIVNLKSGRVYIGYVYRVPPRPHIETAYIEILTEYSLFRNESGKFPERKEWVVYPGAKIAELRAYRGTLTDSIANLKSLPVVDEAMREKLVKLVESKLQEAQNALAKLESIGAASREDWIRVIPIGEVESVSYFDERIFDWFKDDDLKGKASSAGAAPATTLP